jgi:drug/metabolite transporter (DMT)-like permease
VLPPAFTLLSVHKPRFRENSGRAWGIAAVATAAALWAAAASVASRLFDSGVEPLELTEARAFISVIGLALLPAARRRTQGSGEARAAVGALGLCIALVNLAYYTAIDRLAVAVAIILQYSAPALVVVWVALVTRRRPSRQIVVALVAALSGVVLISEVLTGNIGRLDRLGLAMGFASAVLFAAYTLLSERAQAAYGPVPALLRGFGIASLFWIVVQLPRGWPTELLAPDNLPAVLFVGVAGTLIPFLLYVWGVGRIRATRASIAATLEPVLAALFAWVFLNQTLSAMQIAGGVLVIGGVLMLQTKREPVTQTQPQGAL